MRWIKKSLFLKLALLILFSTGIVLAIVMTVSNLNLRKQVIEGQKKYYTSLSSQAARDIDIKFLEAKMVVDKAVVLFKSKAISRTGSLDILKNIVNENPMIGGSAIALAPGSNFSETGFQMLYTWRENDGIKSADRVSPEEDYKSDWFRLPFTQKKEIWTDPYIDPDINKKMVTYSTPVLVKGEVVAVLTCDLILDSVEELLGNLELGHEGAPVLVTNDGRIISYPDNDLVLKETLRSIGERLSDSEDRETMFKLDRFLKQNKSGSFRFKKIDYENIVWLYFNTIALSDWRIGFIIPEEAILSPVYDLNRKMFFIALLGIIALLIPAFFVSHSITRPLKVLCDAADNLAVGNFETRLPTIKKADEIGRLVTDFDRMRIDLKEYINTLATTTAEKEKIASELSIAREIQHGILPKLFPPFPKHAGLDIFATLDSAKEVGGDLYDFALLNDNKLYIGIGDVSGKGVPASLFMAVGKTLLKSTIQTVNDPAKALSIVNNELAENNDACMFITLFCGILDLHTNKLVFANAGHNPPIVVQGEASYFIQQAMAPPLGALPGVEFKNETLQLPDDALFLLYTDGVTEAMNAEKQLFGDDTLLQLLQKSKNHTAEKCIVNIKKQVQQFVGETEQSDDITMLCIANKTNTDALKETNLGEASIVITNSKSEFPRIVSWLEEVGEKLNWPQTILVQLNLALEEWIVNIVSYAFADDEIHEINVKLEQNNGIVKIEITDDGVEFDPTKKQTADTTSSVEERAVGGLGIHFIKNSVDRFTYRRKENMNVVVMEKKLNEDSNG